MLTDYHAHILPALDDGARDTETALAMLHLLQKQGVQRVVATPHFLCHRERSVAHFLEKRQAALAKIQDASPIPILTGAEVALEHGISDVQDITKLAIGNTNLILMELPYRQFESWMADELYHLSVAYGLQVVLAHIHRYCAYVSTSEMQQLLQLDAVFQINADAFDHWKERGLVKELLQSERKIVFGTDCHNMTDRKPNWDVLQKRLRRSTERLHDSNAILDQHLEGAKHISASECPDAFSHP
ncbi:MAG: CpsB/CapC family capsule biosynthesis tyrosine phosphatase [Oscillospiraceae bacterium]